MLLELMTCSSTDCKHIPNPVSYGTNVMLGLETERCKMIARKIRTLVKTSHIEKYARTYAVTKAAIARENTIAKHVKEGLRLAATTARDFDET